MKLNSSNCLSKSSTAKCSSHAESWAETSELNSGQSALRRHQRARLGRVGDLGGAAGYSKRGR
eukprot:224349-Amphidinium_carterae.1